jgi:hypothetical protein
MTIGTDILAAQYVTIQNKAQSLIGTGSGTRGYGQTVQSSDVFTGNTITKAQWDLIKLDIINIKFHQDGVLPGVITVNVGDPINFGASSPNSNYDTILNQAIANRFQIAGSQSVVNSAASTTYSGSWSTSLTATLTCTFSTADEARYFFNSGGKIRFASSLSGGSSTAQINAWTNFLASVGTRSFGADTGIVNYYTLTNSFQIYDQTSVSAAYQYSGNNYRLEARTNVSNNSTGTATQLFLRVTLIDGYADPAIAPHTPNTIPPGDLVNGTVTITASELKAAGLLQPSGTFTVVSPSYSFSVVTAS